MIEHNVLYGAGLKTCINTILSGDKTIPIERAKVLAQDFLNKKKGQKREGKYYGGTDSTVYNEIIRLASLAETENPLSGTKMSTAFRTRVTGRDFVVSKNNWCIQSVGTAFLHYILTTVDYLAQEYGVYGEFVISIHDSICYLTKPEYVKRLACILQIAHLLVWAKLRDKYNLYDFPLNAAWFSSIEEDTVLRKECTGEDANTITISHQVQIPYGKQYGINDLKDEFCLLRKQS